MSFQTVANERVLTIIDNNGGLINQNDSNLIDNFVYLLRWSKFFIKSIIVSYKLQKVE